MNLAEIDDLVDALWRVRGRTDDYDADLALAVALVGEGAEIAPMLRSIGEDCFRAGTHLRRGANELRRFRLRPMGFVAPSDFPRRRRVHSPRSNRDHRFDPDVRRGGSERGTAGSAESASEGSLRKLFVLTYFDLVRAVETVRLAGHPYTPSAEAARSQVDARSDLEIGRNRPSLSIADLKLIAENADIDPHAAKVAAMLLSHPNFLAALGGAASRSGNIFSDQDDEGGETRFSLEDAIALGQHRLLMEQLEPVIDTIDSIRGGAVDGKITSKDFEEFIRTLDDPNSEVALAAQQALDADLFDQTTWQRTADIAADTGQVVAVVTFLVAAGYATQGVAVPVLINMLMTGGAVLIGGVEFTAGALTGDAEHMLNGGLGVLFAGGTPKIGAAAKNAVGLGDDVVKVVDDGVDFLEFTRRGNAVPELSLAEAHHAGALVGFESGQVDNIVAASGGVRPYPGAAFDHSAAISSHLIAQTDSARIGSDFSIWDGNRVLLQSQAADLGIAVVSSAGAPVTNAAAHRVFGGALDPQKRRSDDEVDSEEGRKRPSTPVPAGS